jgi:MFS family permease
MTALGTAWLLDGLEGSLGGSLAGALKQPKALGGLGFTDAQLGLSSSLYLAGAVVGALSFGYMADRWGRRRLFFWTLALYVCATATTALAWDLASFTLCRVLTGAGIGGEYAAINSAVDELMPARVRGRVDLWINGTFWLGNILGSIVTVALLSRPMFVHLSSWRLAFWSGIPISVIVLVMRRFIPESPRWLLAHGEPLRAEMVLAGIESQVAGRSLEKISNRTTIRDPSPKKKIDLSILLSARYRGRTWLCLTLMTAQAFFYNSVFFSLSLVLLRFYSVAPERVGQYFIPIALANFLGPLLLGVFFDTIGRRKMIGASYCFSGLLLLTSALLFLRGSLSLPSQMGLWTVTFVLGSTAASSAYLTVSELFPQQIRASAIAAFYAIGTLAGGVSGPLLFGRIIDTGERGPLFIGYLIGALAMIAAGVIGFIWAVSAEGRSLEQLTDT